MNIRAYVYFRIFIIHKYVGSTYCTHTCSSHVALHVELSDLASRCYHRKFDSLPDYARYTVYRPHGNHMNIRYS